MRKTPRADSVLMKRMRDHRKLHVFRLAHALVLETYKKTKAFPQEERFGLTRQIRRAVVSVPGNIVEGCGRRGEREYVHFLRIAFASLREVGYYIRLSFDLGYLQQEEAEVLSGLHRQTAWAFAALIRSLES